MSTKIRYNDTSTIAYHCVNTLAASDKVYWEDPA